MKTQHDCIDKIACNLEHRNDVMNEPKEQPNDGVANAAQLVASKIKSWNSTFALEGLKKTIE